MWENVTRGDSCTNWLEPVVSLWRYWPSADFWESRTRYWRKITSVKCLGCECLLNKTYILHITFNYSNCLIQVKSFLYFSFISKARMTFTVNSWGRDKLQSLPTLSLSLTLFAGFLFYYSCKILSYFSIWSPQVGPENIYLNNIYLNKIPLILILASLVEKAF